MARLTVDIPDPLVPRFRAILPQGLTPEEAIIRLVRMAIRDYEQRGFANTKGQELDALVRQHLADLNAELGL